MAARCLTHPTGWTDAPSASGIGRTSHGNQRVYIRARRTRLWVLPGRGDAPIARSNRRQKTEFRSQKDFDVASLRLLKKIECAEGENLILTSGF